MNKQIIYLVDVGRLCVTYLEPVDLVKEIKYSIACNNINDRYYMSHRYPDLVTLGVF